jgi:hypothetical protein
VPELEEGFEGREINNKIVEIVPELKMTSGESSFSQAPAPVYPFLLLPTPPEKPELFLLHHPLLLISSLVIAKKEQNS